MSLFKKTAKGITWNFLSTFSNIVIQFIAGIILARLLFPDDFGLLGICYVFINISRSTIDSGLYQALIQKKTPTSGDYSAVFKFNLTIAIILFFIINIAARNIAAFFERYEVEYLLHVLSFIVILESFSLIQKAKIIKEIRFELLAKINLFSFTIAAVVSILLAWKGFGIWSLIAKEILTTFLITTLYWIKNPIKVNINQKSSDFRKLIGFGGRIFLADQIESIGDQISSVIIGKKYTATDLGYYHKAEQFQRIFSQTIVSSVNSVIFPALSTIQDDDEKLKQGYKSIISLLMLPLFPILSSAILTADHFIPFLLGEKWSETIPYFQLLCIGGLVYPFTVINLNIIKVKGMSKLYLNVCIISKGLMIPAIFIGLLFHIKGLVIALIIQRILAAVINSYYSKELINYSLLQQLNDIKIMAFIICGIFVFIFFLKPVINFWLQFELLIILGIPLIVFSLYIPTIVYLDREIFTLAKVVIRTAFYEKK